MNTNELLDTVLSTARFAPTEDTRAELFELLVDNYNEGLSAYTTAHDICRFLQIDHKEFSHPLELVLRGEFNRD